MIANFFKKTKPIHAIFISILFLFFYVTSIFFIERPPFSILLVLEKIVLVLFFLVLFFLIRFINRKNYLSGQDSYVLLTLALLFGMFPHTMLGNKIFISHFFLLFAFRRIYSIQSLKNVKQKVFDSGLWIGVASLFYIWSSVFMILLYLSIYIHKRHEIRNFLIPFVGFITPFFLVFTYYFLIDSTPEFFDLLVIEFSLSFKNIIDFKSLIPISFVGIITLASMVIVRVKVNALANDLKPSGGVLFVHFLIAVYIILLSPEKNGSEFIFAFLPISIFTANLLQLTDNIIVKEILVYGYFAVVCSVYFL